MNYEEKYKEALEKAEGIIKYYKERNRDEASIEDLEGIFPELCESEDEKTRKELIEFVKSRGGFKQEYIAWLEKQGKKPQGKTALEAIKEEKVDNSNKAEPKDYNRIDPHFAKPTDKVEPKFKVGDWIVSNEKLYIYQIEEINEFVVKVREITGETFVVDVKSLKDTHLWTINDAKDGDVLYSPCLSLLWIFKSRDTIYCGCNLNYNDGAFCGEGYFERPTDAIPATKEQRELLFQKMKEAGYTFDFEKKKLRKIHVIDEGKAEMDYCFTKMMAGEKVTPTWSEEVDLEKEFYNFLGTLIGKDNGHLSEDELFRIAEYFYELGLKTKKGE